MQTKGILDSANALNRFTLQRYDPSSALAPFVEQYWIVRWDLPAGETYTTELLPFPNVNVAITNTESLLTGVMTSKYARTLSGRGVVIGAKFLPGGFEPFYRQSIERLTNQEVPLKTVFAASRIKNVVARLDADDAALVVEMEKLLLSRKPQRDDTIVAITAIIDAIRKDPTIRQVQTVCEQFEVSERTLQHSFKNYVGIGLKWIIARYRLQDVADAIDHGQNDWAALALAYGFADQAHFIREFKKVTGETPLQYSKRIRSHEE